MYVRVLTFDSPWACPCELMTCKWSADLISIASASSRARLGILQLLSFFSYKRFQLVLILCCLSCSGSLATLEWPSLKVLQFLPRRRYLSTSFALFRTLRHLPRVWPHLPYPLGAAISEDECAYASPASGLQSRRLKFAGQLPRSSDSALRHGQVGRLIIGC